MTLETFFEKFELFEDVPGAVAKMRELVLELAIRGALVPQDDHNEPSSKLLNRLELFSMSQVGQERKLVWLPPVGDDAYLDLPIGWAWTRLGNTGRIFNGNSVSESGKVELAKVESGLPFIATKDVGYGRDPLAYDNGLKVPFGDPRFKVARANTILICSEGGSAGRKIGITDREVCFGNKLYANEVLEGIHYRFLFYVYQSPTFLKQFRSRMTGIIGGISRSEFLALPIPIPPEEEQKQIVAKVDELMVLCDRLEAEQKEREEKKVALAHASLARFAKAPNPANLNYIFHKSYDIAPADLRKTILTLAVQGKLVPQDPNDESAEALMEDISKRMGRKARMETRNIEVRQDTKLPESWCLATFPELGELGRGKSKHRPRNDPALFADGTYRLVQTGDVARANGIIKTWTSMYNDVGLEQSRLWPKGTLCITIAANIADSGILGFEACFPDSIVGFIPATPIQAVHYFEYFMRTAKEKIEQYAPSTAQKNINLGVLRQVQIPLPPLTEQHRIVAKVDQLMALVDELDAQLAASRVTGEKLLAALVVELTTLKKSLTAA